MRYTELMRTKHQYGFTLIELLVVVAIISMLAGTILVSFQDPKKRARDTRRMEQINQIAKALELYNNKTGHFPVSTAITVLNGTDIVSTTLTQNDTISQIPIDPMAPTYQIQYQSDTSGGTYVMTFCLETTRIAGYALGCGNVYTP
jgi:general secretion pathway protein G